jgi:hypothetical protein
LKEGVDGLLTELHEFVSQPSRSNNTSAPKPPPDLDALTPVELAAHTENLRARLLELGRWERQRKLVRKDDVTDIFIEALTIAKMLMRAIPGRTDQLVAHAKDVGEVIAILDREVEGIVAASHVDLSPLLKE